MCLQGQTTVHLQAIVEELTGSSNIIYIFQNSIDSLVASPFYISLNCACPVFKLISDDHET